MTSAMWRFISRTPQAEARRRGVELLLHSTHLFKNLPHILEDGLLRTAGSLIAKYGSAKAARFLHDPRRYEQFAVGLDYLNCSLSFPNAELLYRRSKSDWKSEWIHFSLELNLLNDSATRFCPLSAATGYGAHIVSGLEGFRLLFAETVAGRNRAQLPRIVPTHPQAEILVHGALELKMVRSLIVGDHATQIEVQRLCNLHHRDLRIEIAPHLFTWPEWLLRH